MFVFRNQRKGVLARPLCIWQEKYGNIFNLRLLWENRYWTCEPEHIKCILATEFDKHEKGSVFRSVVSTVLGTGVFSADDELWKFHRSMTRPFFVRARISDFDVFDRHAQDAIRLLKSRAREGYAVDLQDLFSRFTLDSATEFLFGYDVRSLSESLPYPHSASPTPYASSSSRTSFSSASDFSTAFSAAQSIMFERNPLGTWWPLREFWEDKTRKHMRVIEGVIDPILARALAREKARRAEIGAGAEKADTKNSGALEVAEGETLLEYLVKVTDDPVILKDEMINIMVAGRDTTATLLTFASYMFSEHPDVLKRLREEVVRTVGDRRPTYDDIRNMKYMRAVLNETLRLFPPVPLNLRKCKTDVLWPSKRADGRPYYVPAGTTTPYSVWHLHRLEYLWGPDAHVFDPDRFLDERVHRLSRNPFMFLPFNAGPRICLGQQFAYNEASFMLVRLLQTFSSVELDMAAVPPGKIPPVFDDMKRNEKVWIKSHLTSYVDGGLWVKLGEA
ncbi:cytochrome P450 [Punctularia strigosozonata HHB-11173 SS5]|uniref:Cytochrome P450 n=1 Tax=Punctularia strigosozonata (strain HHB-11173) TaxID=741275 RepID=R7S145_PUNST|nr:cytochrome P450 [Punctularia strigosozonata HHB-11173 SS5]EIN04100.1 cytochrome P450 [Punctularia strigosozonata HHB-11173 SS5]